MKKIFILGFFFQLFSLGSTFPQRKKDLEYLEKVSLSKYPQDLKNFLESHKENILQFYFLNEKYQVINTNDISILESANTNIQISESLEYANSALRNYFGKHTSPKILPFATSLDHWSDDKIDFLGILQSSSAELNGKIVYVNGAYTPILPAIVANNISNIFGSMKNFDLKNKSFRSDTVLLEINEGADKFLYNLNISKANLFKYNLRSLKIKQQTNLPDLINSQLSLADSNSLQKVTLILEWFNKGNFYSQKFIFLDESRPIKDKSSYSNRFNWTDYTRLYTFYIKSLFLFRNALSQKGIDLNPTLSTIKVDCIVKNALFNYFMNEGSAVNIEKETRAEFPPKLVTLFDASPEYNYSIELDNYKFITTRRHDGYNLEDYMQDLEFFELKFNLSQRIYNGISDSAEVLPFTMSNLGNGSVKYLSVIRSNIDKLKKYDGNILLSNYSSTFWSPNSKNSIILSNSYEDFAENHPPEMQEKYTPQLQENIVYGDFEIIKYDII